MHPADAMVILAARRMTLWLVLLALSCTGCFGDWVRAKKVPRRDEVVITKEDPPKEDPPKEDPLKDASQQPADDRPEGACTRYRDHVVQLCHKTLDGQPTPASCHAELIKFATVYYASRRDTQDKTANGQTEKPPSDKPAPEQPKLAQPDPTEAHADPDATTGLDASDVYTERQQQSCLRYLKALRDAPAPVHRADPRPLGPQCQAWGEALRRRCIDPISVQGPLPPGCTATLLAFQTTVRGAAFGDPRAHEPACKQFLDKTEVPIGPE